WRPCDGRTVPGPGPVRAFGERLLHPLQRMEGEHVFRVPRIDGNAEDATSVRAHHVARVEHPPVFPGIRAAIGPEHVAGDEHDAVRSDRRPSDRAASTQSDGLLRLRGRRGEQRRHHHEERCDLPRGVRAFSNPRPLDYFALARAMGPRLRCASMVVSKHLSTSSSPTPKFRSCRFFLPGFYPERSDGESVRKHGTKKTNNLGGVEWRALLDSNQWPSASETDALSN